MVHFSVLSKLLLGYFSDTDLVSREQYFIFIDIYGQYVVYQKSISHRKNYKKDLERVKADLTNLTGPWLDDVCDPKDDYFGQIRIN